MSKVAPNSSPTPGQPQRSKRPRRGTRHPAFREAARRDHVNGHTVEPGAAANGAANGNERDDSRATGRFKAGQTTPKLSAKDREAVPSLVDLARRDPKAVLGILGPGLIAGAADNDPTTVASLAVVGATTGYALSWLLILVIPMLVVVQAISASVGVVARTGLEDAIRKRFGSVWAFVAMAAVLTVSVITLAADIEGGSAAIGLLTHLPWQWFVIPFAAGAAALLVWGSYSALQNVLKYILLVFLAYIVTAFLAKPNWGEVALYTFIPHLSLSSDYIAGALALLGTTLTSYAYVWETIEEGAERPPLRRLGLVKADAGIGMIAAGALFWFILIGTGATLGVHHTQVQTAQDAAKALAPIAGPFASILFGVGLLASAVLAVPVLAGTSAYVSAEMFGWRRSLDATFHRAPKFYIALLASLAAAVLLTFLGIGPIQLLFISSIAGGLGTPITLALMMLLARDSRTMKGMPIGKKLEIGGWIVTAIVTLACGLFLWQTVTGH